MIISQWADLEITLHRDKEGGYSVDLRFDHPSYDAMQHLRHNQITALTFNRERLRALTLDAPAYGLALGEMLFTDAIRQKFAEYRAMLNGLPMRVRLVIGTDASELQGLRWETLRIPESGDYLLGARTPFSRYVSPVVDRVASSQYRDSLRALIFIANPRGLVRYNIRPIDTATYLNFARQIVGSHQCVELIEDRATLDNLRDALQHGCDLLYIVAHGGILGDEPCLTLTGDDGDVVITPVQSLLHHIRNLTEMPRLAILISCESAGNGQDAPQDEPMPLVALGPLLAEAGVPAVIAMQGRISIETANRFLKVFVEQLQHTGVIDAAAAVARDSVHGRPDAWMPVLFMQSKSGVFWQRPQPVSDRLQPVGGRPHFDKWKTLIHHIKDGKCVPIIGPGLLEPLIGSSRDLALSLVQKHSLDLEPPAQASLPHVAQLLQLGMDRTAFRHEITEALYEALVRHSGVRLPDKGDARPLHEWLRYVNCERHGFDPYQALASLPCPLFVNAAPDSLLERALYDTVKNPHVVICPWSTDLQWAKGAFPFDDPTISATSGEHLSGPSRKIHAHRQFVPTDENPVVYHPFGLFQLLSSLVLTEDDYFQYLVGNTKNQNKMPASVRYGLTGSALLFLGFQLDDWGFRVLLREILQFEGSALREEFTHVAVQIDPSTASRTVEQRVEYLEKQFHSYHITVYWGQTTDFIRQLTAEYAQRTLLVPPKSCAVGH